MVETVPAHIDGDRIVPERPLPDPRLIRRVTIVVETEPEALSESDLKARAAAFARLDGLLKGRGLDPDTLKEDYINYLEEKYR